MSKQRNIRTAQEKFKIVMEGLRGDYGSIAALCNAHGITQTDFYRWRDILMENGSRLFERGGVDKERQRLETTVVCQGCENECEVSIAFRDDKPVCLGGNNCPTGEIYALSQVEKTQWKTDTKY